MDRPATCALDHPTAVRTAESAALDLLLPAAAGERREPAPDAAARRAVSGMSLLRQPPHGGDAGGEPQTRPAAHGDYGNRSSLSETELEPPGAGSRDLPIPAARPVDRAAQPGLEHRYYIYSDAWRVPLPGRCHGLVQPLRAELGTLQYHGDRLLSGCAGSRVSLRPTRDLELRSGFPIHRRGFSSAPEKARRQDQHGWTRPRPGQCFHRATVAQLEVRAHLSRRLRQWGRPVSGVGPLHPFLQLSAPAPSARLPHAGRSIPVRVEEEESVAMMGGFAPPTPQDLSLFLPEWMFFCLPVLPSCFIIGKLDRRIGQRRDATRAPTQARNGWRPSGRLLVTPPHHLSDGQNLSNLWGPPQYSRRPPRPAPARATPTARSGTGARLALAPPRRAMIVARLRAMARMCRGGFGAEA